MEIPRFENFVKHRVNVLDESWLDWLRGKKSPTPTPTPEPEGPQSPEERQTDPQTNHYFNLVWNLLGLQSGMAVLDDSGKPTGAKWNGADGLDRMQHSLKNIISGHIYGTGNQHVFMRVSQMDVKEVFDFLDHLQDQRTGKSVAEAVCHSQNINDFLYWLRKEIKTHPQAMHDTGFPEFARKHDIARSANRTPAASLDKIAVKSLWTKVLELGNFVNTPGVQRQSGLHTLMVEILSLAHKLEAHNVPVDNVVRNPGKGGKGRLGRGAGS